MTSKDRPRSVTLGLGTTIAQSVTSWKEGGTSSSGLSEGHPSFDATCSPNKSFTGVFNCAVWPSKNRSEL